MKDYTYTLTNERNIFYNNSYTFYVSKSMWCRLAPNSVNRLVNSILGKLISMFIHLINKVYQ